MECSICFEKFKTQIHLKCLTCKNYFCSDCLGNVSDVSYNEVAPCAMCRSLNFNFYFFENFGFDDSILNYTCDSCCSSFSKHYKNWIAKLVKADEEAEERYLNLSMV